MVIRHFTFSFDVTEFRSKVVSHFTHIKLWQVSNLILPENAPYNRLAVKAKANRRGALKISFPPSNFTNQLWNHRLLKHFRIAEGTYTKKPGTLVMQCFTEEYVLFQSFGIWKLFFGKAAREQVLCYSCGKLWVNRGERCLWCQALN